MASHTCDACGQRIRRYDASSTTTPAGGPTRWWHLRCYSAAAEAQPARSVYVLRMTDSDGTRWYLHRHGSVTCAQTSAMRFDSRAEAEAQRAKCVSRGRWRVVRLVRRG